LIVSFFPPYDTLVIVGAPGAALLALTV